MKRTERHHLKENIVRTGLDSVAHFVKNWQKELYIGAGVLAIAVLVFAALFALRSRQMGVQSRMAGEILKIAGELDTNPEKLPELEKLAGKGRFARLGTIELAKYWLGKGEFAKADSSLETFPRAPKDLLYYQAENLKARAATLKKDYDKAIAIYRKIEADNPAAYPLDAALFHLAEAYELKGDVGAARDIYQKLQAEYTQSYYGYEASVKAGRLQLGK